MDQQALRCPRCFRFLAEVEHKSGAFGVRVSCVNCRQWYVFRAQEGEFTIQFVAKERSLQTERA